MWKTIEICPSSIRDDPQVISACEALDLELAAMYECMASVPGGILFWPFTDVAVPPLLDVIAWEMHVDVWQGWDGDLSIEEKRTLINESIEWHRHLGTKWVVEQMLKTVFRKGHVQEWYEYSGRPYYFRIVTEEPWDEGRFNAAWEGIMAVKNVRSWMEEGLGVVKQTVAQMYVTILVNPIYKHVYIPVATNPDLSP